MTFERNVQTVKQIEVTTRCNLACTYCPQPTMPRPKRDMSMDVFEAALRLVAHFRERGSQGELSLTGLGDGLLHPAFPEMLAAARGVLGWELPLVFSTNGILLTEKLAEKIAPFRPRVYVSLHRPEVAAKAVEVARRYDILAGTNAQFVTAALDWAGQVDWHVSAPRITCEFLRSGWGVILVDGKITTCCLDADNSGIVGTVWSDPATLTMRPYRLCEACTMDVPEAVM